MFRTARANLLSIWTVSLIGRYSNRKCAVYRSWRSFPIWNALTGWFSNWKWTGGCDLDENGDFHKGTFILRCSACSFLFWETIFDRFSNRKWAVCRSWRSFHIWKSNIDRFSIRTWAVDRWWRSPLARQILTSRRHSSTRNFFFGKMILCRTILRKYQLHTILLLGSKD